jgi:precorrin-6A synthase
MRKILIIGIGAGNPDHITVQAINALNRVDVFFVIDKGADKDDLVVLRRDLCARYIKDRSYRTVEIPDPVRDRASRAYEDTVQAWHAQRLPAYETALMHELDDGECGAFLVWGDPSLYDSTLRILDQIVARGVVAFEHEVIPGITSVQALAAAHRIALNRIGAPVEITTGRRIAQGLPEDVDDIVVMLDGDCAFKGVAETDVEIYWGAYLGTEDEILRSGNLRECASDIERLRREARARKGWIMDTYLLRRAASARR